ncbi:threonine ammonia-lyase [Peribacillus saganii]|uniref:threonine ammonia-lyase n=1 Tax=Peribacillus saganii TaxID=2303992 RepID=UPI002D76E47A|nr:threonine/serine dehydratase [Peribacillus saganii]
MKTPILSYGLEDADNQIFLKAEHLQKTNSFKIRGATNKLLKEVQNGAMHAVTASSGNHGQAVAYNAFQLGIKATIVTPTNVVLPKLQAIQKFNGKIELCGTTSEERIAHAQSLTLEKGTVFVHPYDDWDIIAGQGTIGLEVLDQVSGLDAVYVPIGGGGLISGIAAAIKESNPRIKVIGAEPELANDTFLSLQQGTRRSIGETTTIADGLRTSIPGEKTFPIVQKYVDEVILVSENQIQDAFTWSLTKMKQLIEPSSAVAVAAALRHPKRKEKVLAVVSGGNVDPQSISQYLNLRQIQF